MKKHLIQDAQTLAKYSLTSPKLWVGVADDRPNLRRKPGRQYGQNIAHTGVRRTTADGAAPKRTTRVSGSNPQRRDCGGSSNAQTARALSDLKQRIARSTDGPLLPPLPYRSPHEMLRARINQLCFRCMKSGHRSRYCPELSKPRSNTAAPEAPVVKKEANLVQEGENLENVGIVPNT